MIYGKVCNAAATITSTMRCYICGQITKDFNKINKKSENRDALEFGLSVLYARIRFFESLRHLIYKIPIKKWRSQEDKKLVSETTQKIKNRFKEKMGLLMDLPDASFGNINARNTPKNFFSDP